MKSSVSSKLRLLLDSSPLCDVDPETLAAQEDSVAAWQLDVGQELAAENIPLAHVVLVVEGTLRVSGRDALGNPFTLRRIHSGEWFGLWSALLGISAATCRTTEPTKLLVVPVEIWQEWFSSSPELAKWLETHPQREDLYAALRPLLVQRPRQDLTFIDVIDQLQASMRVAQLRDPQGLQSLVDTGSDISWLIPSVTHILSDLEPYGSEGLSPSSLERALQRSPCGLRLIGYPTASLQELFDFPSTSSPLE